MFKKIWNSETKTIASAALILGGASLASRILGVVRDRILAGRFGAGDVLDAYYAAFRLPDTIFSLLVFGALSAGFIPVFTEYLVRSERDRASAWRLVNEVLGYLSLGLIGLSAVIIIAAPWLVPLIAPGFTGEKLALTIHLTRIMALSPVIMGISALFGGVLQATRRFAAFALAPLLYNIGIIIGITLFVPVFGLVGLAYGVVLGAILHFISQLAAVFAHGYKLRPTLGRVDSGLARVAKLSLPRILALAVTQVDLTVSTLIASSLLAGSVAEFTFASNLQTVPVALIGISYAIAAFPSLSRHASKNEGKEFISSVSNTMRQVLFLVIPVSVLVLLLRAQFVRLVLGSGRFDWNDTINTANILGFFALSIFAQSVVPLLSRAFYALKDSITPLLVGLISIGVSIIGSITLSSRMGVAGLGLAFTLASITQVALLFVTLRLKTGSLDELRLITSLSKISVGAICMALAGEGMKYLVAPLVGTTTFVGILAQTVSTVLVGSAVYIGVMALLKSQEATDFIASMRKRVGIKEIPVVAADEVVDTNL